MARNNGYGKNENAVTYPPNIFQNNPEFDPRVPPQMICSSPFSPFTTEQYGTAPSAPAGEDPWNKTGSWGKQHQNSYTNQSRAKSSTDEFGRHLSKGNVFSHQFLERNGIKAI